jgi:hypothetical protein
MDMNEYCLQMMTRQRLTELRAEANAIAARELARPRTPLRVTLGQGLVRLGTRLLHGVTPLRTAAGS